MAPNYWGRGAAEWPRWPFGLTHRLTSELTVMLFVLHPCAEGGREDGASKDGGSRGPSGHICREWLGSQSFQGWGCQPVTTSWAWVLRAETGLDS